jgi:16S rRNA (adenine1518-N6/adenine1519-N6)-dimethyltransferase
MTLHAKLARLDLHPKKSLGQNFMVDENALIQMAEAGSVGSGDTVLEIGAGLGALTKHLAERARRVIALEIDGRLIDELRKLFNTQPHVEVVQGDILQTDLGILLGEDVACYKVVANLPYYITSAIIRHLLECSTPPQFLVVTVQYEVALRLSASPGNMSLLAVGVQFYGRPHIVSRLRPGAFYPQPTVDSALVCIEPNLEGPSLAPKEQPDFFRIVRAGFSQPRKKLKNSLSAGLRLSPDATMSWMKRASLDPGRRAETLSIAEWLDLYHAQETQAPENLLSQGQ